MSRSQEKLKKVEDEISEYIFPSLPPLPSFTHIIRTHTHTFIHLMVAEEKYKREVVVIPVDFSDGLEIYPNIAEQLKDLDIGVLSKLVGRNNVQSERNSV